MTEVIIKQSVTPSEWLQVPQINRNKLRAIFGIKPSGSSHVVSGSNGKSYVTSDGFTPQDLLGITVEKLQEYCGLIGATAKDANDIHILFQEAAIRVAQPAGTVNTQVDDVFKRPEEAVSLSPLSQSVSAPVIDVKPLKTKKAKNNA